MVVVVVGRYYHVGPQCGEGAQRRATHDPADQDLGTHAHRVHSHRG